MRCVSTLSCASALLIDENAVEKCACCSSITNVRHRRYTSPTTVSNPESISFPDRRTSVMLVNVDGYGEARGNCVPLNTAVCSTCRIVLSVHFSFLRALPLSLSISIPLARSLSHSVVLSFSIFLPLSLFCAPWWFSPSLSFFLSVSHSTFVSLARSFSRSMTGPLTLLFSLPHTPPTLSFSLSYATVMDLSTLRSCV